MDAHTPEPTDPVNVQVSGRLNKGMRPTGKSRRYERKDYRRICNWCGKEVWIGIRGCLPAHLTSQGVACKGSKRYQGLTGGKSE
jgi:hypothetical protein